MARVEAVSVSSTKAYEVTGPDGSSITVQNTGPDSCFFATASTVSSSSNDGTLTSGSSLSFSPSKFFISSGTSRLVVTGPIGDQFRQYDDDNGQSGAYALGPYYSSVTLTPTASRSYWQRYRTTRAMTIVTISFEVQTAAGADDAFSVGIHNSTGTSLLSTSGAVTGVSGSVSGGGLNATAGLRVVTLPTPLVLAASTTYYVGWSVGTFGGTAVGVRGLSYLAAPGTGFFGTTMPNVEAIQQSATHPLPATIAASAAPIVVPLLVLRES